MCFVSPDTDDSALRFQQEQAALARAEEEARQARIAEGMQQIAAIFEGGEFAPALDPIEAVEVVGIPNPDFVPAQFKPGKDGEFTPAVGSRTLPSIPGATIGDFVIPSDIERGPTQTFEGLQPVLDQRREALEGFLLPQLNDQFNDAKDDLSFALARSGQLTSSTAGERQADLSQAFSLNRADIDSRIQGDVAQTQSQIQQQRRALESALRASGDQTASTNNALATATTFRQDTPSLSPLSNLFQGISAGIGAINQGFENGRIKKLTTPNPLGGGTGRVVRT